MPLPLAVHPDRPWLLLDDAGPTLRQTRPDGTGDHDLAAWERILAEYAELQRSLETGDAVAAMLAAGTPDGRPAALPGELARLLDEDAWWERLSDEEREEGAVARRTLREQLPLVAGRPKSSLLLASRPPSSTTISTAETSWSARTATASSTGATLSWRTRSGP